MSDGCIVPVSSVPLGTVLGVPLMRGATGRLVEKMLDIGVRGAIGRLARRHGSRGGARLTGEVDGAVLLHAARPEDQVGMRIQIIVSPDHDPARFGLRGVEDPDLGHLAAGVPFLPLHHTKCGSRVVVPRWQATHYESAGERGRWLLHRGLAPKTEHWPMPFLRDGGGVLDMSRYSLSPRGVVRLQVHTILDPPCDAPCRRLRELIGKRGALTRAAARPRRRRPRSATSGAMAL
jgi:hypothetical protein